MDETRQNLQNFEEVLVFKLRTTLKTEEEEKNNNIISAFFLRRWRLAAAINNHYALKTAKHQSKIVTAIRI